LNGEFIENVWFGEYLQGRIIHRIHELNFEICDDDGIQQHENGII